MKKILPLIILILLFIFIYFFVNKPKPVTPRGVNQTTDMKQQEEQQPSSDLGEKISGSLLDLVKMGKSLQCSGNYNYGDSMISTTAYVSGEKSYSETYFKQDDGTEMNSYTIFDGEWFYTWSDDGMGTKMKLEEIEKLGKKVAEDAKTDTTEVTDDEQSVQTVEQDADYDCKPWRADSSMFTPPADIEFVDFATMMQQLMPQNSDGTPALNCSVCDSLEDESAVNQCKAALGC